MKIAVKKSKKISNVSKSNEKDVIVKAVPEKAVSEKNRTQRRYENSKDFVEEMLASECDISEAVLISSMKKCEIARKKSIRRYMRDENGNYVGCLVAMKEKERIRIGYSVCHQNDKPSSRRVAGMFAEMSAFLYPAGTSEDAVECDGTIPLKLQDQLPSFMARCCKYFQTSEVEMYVANKTTNGYGRSYMLYRVLN